MMDLKSLALPPQTEEQRQKWTADFNEKQRIESEKQSDRVQKSWDESQNLFAQQQQNHKQMRIEEQVEAMRIFEAEKHQVNVDAGTEPKQKGRNEKRTDILKEWYAALILKHQNDIEVINQEIDDLTNEA